MRVLLVEDEHEQAVLFAQVLEILGYTVDIVGNAEEAQSRLTVQSYALLLADWDLRGAMLGDALIDWALARDAGIKTVLFSNHPQVAEVAAQCGAHAAFRKIDGIGRLRQLVTELAPPSLMTIARSAR